MMKRTVSSSMKVEKNLKNERRQTITVMRVIRRQKVRDRTGG